MAERVGFRTPAPDTGDDTDVVHEALAGGRSPFRSALEIQARARARAHSR